MQTKSRNRLALATLAALTALLAALWAFPRHLLCVDDPAPRADVIVLLGGRAPERVERAAQLFLAGDAPRILVSGAGDTLDNQRVLLARGVPEPAIQLEDQSQSTRQNALFSLPLLRAMHAQKVILVTSWYHSRRALHSFRYYGPGLTFYSCPSHFAIDRTAWSAQGTWRHIRAEYVKIPVYWLCYGISPF